MKGKKHYESIKQKLNDRVESAFKHGEISSDCYRQAIGKAPRPIDKRLDTPIGQAYGSDEQGRKLSPTGSKVVVLNHQ